MARENDFIDYLCQQIRQFDLNRTNLCVVLPSIRLQRVLTKRLSKQAESAGQLPCWLPGFSTIDRLIGEFSGLRKAESVELLAILYQSYRDIYRKEHETPRTFDRFWEWGRMLLSDFNQIDNQLAPAEEILSYIAEEKRIGSWHLDLQDSAGELQNTYLAFYRRLWPIYRDFTARLLESGCAYTGLAGRTACRQLPVLLESGRIPPHTFYLFAGLNALTAAEQQIIKTLIRNRRAEILWNADRYYTDAGSGQEAGFFLRKYMQDPDLNHHLNEAEIADRIRRTEIEIIECPQRSSQVKTAARLIESLPEVNDTAIVLNDESLFAPVMNSIPSRLACNATIASSLSGTLSAAFYTTLLQAKESVFRNRSRHIHAQTILQLMRNPLWEILSGQPRFGKTGSGERAIDQTIETILQENRVYFSEEEFRALLPSRQPLDEWILPFIFKDTGSGEAQIRPVQTLSCLRQTAGFLLEKARIQSRQDFRPVLFEEADTRPESVLNLFEQNYLLGVEENCKTLMDILERFPELDFGFASMQNLFTETLSGIGLNYTGEQEHHLNVMGMLETRGLGFRHAILLSMNEGILPSVPSQESFLLHSVKEHYGIPTQTEQTAMQAYHFYSLLQECDKVTLMYVGSPSDKNAEKSRFLLQLEHELPDRIVSVSQHSPFTLRHPQYELQDLRIAKSPSVIKAFQGKLASGLSFSSIAAYLQCPMRFYFDYIMRLEEVPDIGDELDAGLKGDVFHYAMEIFFTGKGPDRKDRRNLILQKEDADCLRKESEALIRAGMEEKFKGGHFDHGKNFLACQEIKIWLERYAAALEKEIEQGELTVLDCEKKFPLDCSDLIPGVRLRLLGVADRIDLYRPKETGAGLPRAGKHASGEAGGYLRIIDYKTGKIKNLNPDDWDLLKEQDGKQALQLMLYIFLYRSLYPRDRRSLQACICSLRNKGEMFALGGPLLEEASENDLLERIREFLRETVSDMLDPRQAIRCTDNPDHCEYCAYTGFCRARAATAAL